MTTAGSSGGAVSGGGSISIGETSGESILNGGPQSGGRGASGGETQEVGCIPSEERCNDVDDDCDANVDEVFLTLGEACEVGFGVCLSTGQITCSEEGADVTCAALVIEPSAEVCNDLDDDCDGVVDEEVARCCVVDTTRACGVNVGACTAGVQTCSPEGWSACDGVGPSAESCDGADNDCDQLVDEGVLNACGGCGSLPTEICDGVDNNCNGRVDEGVTNACGACGPLPTEICDQADNDCDGRVDEGVANACGQCGALPDESCDGADNDCDGRTDERLTRDACSVGQGACRRTGREACIGASYECDVLPGSPTNEVCDGVDNDCDGELDERSNGVGTLCVETCNGADDDDDGNVDEGVTNACGQCGPLPDEVCDETDNDCDGQTDEGVTNACGACGPLPAEVCNGADEDCDGRVDEGVTNACGACGAAPMERCDGLDNDCDGALDEGLGLGNACASGQGVCRRTGVRVCGVRGGVICNASPGAGEDETCDNADNDCDGSVDEDFDLNTDHLNCGSCGAFCVVNGTCERGECLCGGGPPCPPGYLCNASVGSCQLFSFP